MDLEHFGCAICFCFCCELCLNCVKDNESAIHHERMTNVLSSRPPPIEKQPAASNLARSTNQDLSNEVSTTSK